MTGVILAGGKSRRMDRRRPFCLGEGCRSFAGHSMYLNAYLMRCSL